MDTISYDAGGGGPGGGPGGPGDDMDGRCELLGPFGMCSSRLLLFEGARIAYDVRKHSTVCPGSFGRTCAAFVGVEKVARTSAEAAANMVLPPVSVSLVGGWGAYVMWCGIGSSTHQNKSGVRY